jgi:serine/threonine protein phosphatase 1
MGWTGADLLVTLGDYVDRGPDTRGVLEWLMAKHRGGGLIALRGNHEVMMLMAREEVEAQKSWLSPHVGGVAALDSYGQEGKPGTLSDVPPSHWSFLRDRTRLSWENESFFFAHAGVDPDRPLSQQKEGRLLWQRFGLQEPHPSGKLLVCGHTEQDSHVPLLLPHGVCIDTAAHAGGWLTALVVETGEYAQANQRGEYRTGIVEGWLE